MKYKLALCLHKLYNTNLNPKEFVLRNENQIFYARQELFFTTRSNKIKICMNCLANRLHSNNGIIPLSWLNLAISTI